MDRPSMWSQKVMADWLKAAVCPGCGEQNRAGVKPLIEIGADGAYCNSCGTDWAVSRPRAVPVE